VLSPSELAGIYPDAPFSMNPSKFNFTAELVLPSATDICRESLSESLNFTGKIVLVVNSTKNLVFILTLY
jgi:hypothetical protein